MQVLNGSATVNDVPTFTQNFSVVHTPMRSTCSSTALQHCSMLKLSCPTITCVQASCQALNSC